MSFKPALLIIDLQEDFLPPNGPLAVPHGRDIIPLITTLITDYQWAAIIATKDWHPASHCSFGVNNSVDPFTSVSFTNPRNPEEKADQIVWPVHCVQNTPGAEFPPELKKLESKIDKSVLKGQNPDCEQYSAFNDVWNIQETELDSYLKEKEISDVFVVGLAMDYCVMCTAKDAAKRGYKTRIVREATMPVDPNAWNTVPQKLEQEHGVEVVHVSEPVLQSLKTQ